jgi:transcriptional regulator with XRE-family HTH domain
LTDAEIMAQSPVMDMFFQNLEKALNAMGLQWKDLAARSGVSASSISRIKNGSEDMTFTRAEKLTSCIGYSFWEIVQPDFTPRRESSSRANSPAA